MDRTDESTPGSDREPEEVVCPNPDCNIDQRWDRVYVLCCPECAAKLVPACSRCDSGAVERDDDGTPLCSEHAGQPVATDGGVDQRESDRCPACGTPAKLRYDRGDGDSKSWLCPLSDCRVEVFGGDRRV